MAIRLSFLQVITENTEIVAQLLAAGADVNATDNDGDTALMRASTQGHTEIVKLLKQHVKLLKQDIVQQVVPRHLERQKR